LWRRFKDSRSLYTTEDRGCWACPASSRPYAPECVDGFSANFAWMFVRWHNGRMTSAELAYAEVNGHSVAYRCAGEGPPLVLLHGFLSDSRCWRPQLTHLSDRFRVVAWDAPGAGSSYDPPEQFTTTDWARCLAGFLDVVDIERAQVLGLSWGGILAQEFYRLHPERVLALVLCDTYAGWKGSLPESVCQKRLERCYRDSYLPPEDFVERWIPEFFAEAASLDLKEEMSAVVSEYHPLGFRLMAKSSADTDTTDLLPDIEVPTLLVWGDDDRRSPIDIAQQFRDAIPEAELAVIANAGHVSNMEQPEEFDAQVRRFCLSNIPA
jgi:pimeloyl-ACP methyl ester carboxylesterase